MATVQERVGILETKVDGINEKIDDIRADVKSSHLDIKDQLHTMYSASCEQHAQLATKIKDIEGFKTKWTYIIFGAATALSWVVGYFDIVSKILGK